MESGGTNLHCTRLHAVAQGPLCRPHTKCTPFLPYTVMTVGLFNYGYLARWAICYKTMHASIERWKLKRDR